MKQALLTLSLLFFQAQENPPGIQTVFFVDGVQTLVQLGDSFEIRAGKLEVKIPQPTITEVTGQRLPWDNTQLGWILPPGTITNLRVYFYGHHLRRRLVTEQDSFWDYEVVGNLVKPRINPWPSTWHTYFDFKVQP